MASRKPTFTFDAHTHAYLIDGVRVPSITQILRVAYPPSPFWTDEARARGSLVHKLTEQFDLGLSVEPCHDPAVVGRLRAYEKFLRERRPVYTAIECPRVSVRWQFGGRPDREGYWPDGRPFVIDLKCGPVEPQYGQQTAAQTILAHAAESPTVGPVPDVTRYTLHLRADGTYRIQVWNNGDDFGAFLFLRSRAHTEGLWQRTLTTTETFSENED